MKALSAAEPATSGARTTAVIPRKSAWRSDLIGLGVMLGLLFFLFLGQRPLANPDEGRYAEIPREMLQSGDFLTPRLNGVKYFEKPPLVYWLSVGAMKILGVNEWSARAGMAAFAVLGGLLTYVAGRALFGRAAGWWSTIVLSTSVLFYGLSRLALIDLVMAVLMSAALFCFLFAVNQPAGWRRRGLFWGFYAAMALAVLTKGLIGFLLPCGVAFFWLLLLNRWDRLRPCHPFTGAALLLAIAAPWHVMMARAHPDFLQFYFVHEHVQRFASAIHDRQQPWWFFGAVLVGGLFPWTVFGLQALPAGPRTLWRQRRDYAEVWFLLIWIGLILLFFSSSQSKLIPYLLPVFPAAAILVGRYLAAAWERREVRGLNAGLFVFAALAAALGFAAGWFKLPLRSVPADLRLWQHVLAGGLVIGGLGVAVSAMLGAKRLALMTLIASTLLTLVSANFIAGPLDVRSTKSLALELKPLLRPGDAVYVLGEYYQDFPAYLGRTVDVVEYEGELAFGIHAEPERTASRFLTAEGFRGRWSTRGKMAYAIVKRSEVSTWLDQPGLHFKVLAETPTLLLVANHTPPGRPKNNT